MLVGEPNPNPPILAARKLKPAHLVAIEKYIDECHASRGKAVTIGALVEHLGKGGAEFAAVEVLRGPGRGGGGMGATNTRWFLSSHSTEMRRPLLRAHAR